MKYDTLTLFVNIYYSTSFILSKMKKILYDKISNDNIHFYVQVFITNLLNK